MNYFVGKLRKYIFHKYALAVEFETNSNQFQISNELWKLVNSNTVECVFNNFIFYEENLNVLLHLMPEISEN